MKQAFEFKIGKVREEREHDVVAQMQYDDGKNNIRISRIKVDGEIKYVFEKNGDASYVGESFIRKGFPWAITLLPLSKLTAKQSQVLRCVLVPELASELPLEEETFKVDEFNEIASAYTGMKVKAIEGILSSLWVKGYITVAEFVGTSDKQRYFTIDAFGLEYLKSAQPCEHVVVEDEDEEEDEEEA